MTAAELHDSTETGGKDTGQTETLSAIRHLVGVYCLETGQTPRRVLGDEFSKAPSDDFWRATIGATR